jgi:hypothetical protein
VSYPRFSNVTSSWLISLFMAVLALSDLRERIAASFGMIRS